MKTIVKALICDDADNVLVLVRSNTHPRYANEDDLPGGELEGHENPADSVIREIREETNLIVNSSGAREVFKKTVNPNTCHVLYSCRVSGNEPTVQLSWEHGSYSWIKSLEEQPLQSKDDYISTVNSWLASNRLSS